MQGELGNVILPTVPPKTLPPLSLTTTCHQHHHPHMPSDTTATFTTIITSSHHWEILEKGGGC